jgi:predicted GIY-YIG superfamily endonuclease
MSRPSLNTPHVVYRLFGESDELLYIGCSARLGRRLKDHHGKPWWNQVVRFTFTDSMPMLVALRAESKAIATENPRFNINLRGPKQVPA